VSFEPRPPEPILHVDMDAFYAAVEVRRDPSLAGRPVLVGGRGGRGVVASASYEARAFGVRSAMPMAQALRRCPGAVVVAPDFRAYADVSAQLRAVLLDTTPLVEPLALDEAFLDVAGAVRLLGPPGRIGESIRRRIADELGLTASVGVAPNKFVAKVASTKAKPDGLLHVPAERVRAFLGALPVADLWGVGPATARRLQRAGLCTVAEVAALDERVLQALLGARAGSALARLAVGRDDRPVTPAAEAKGMSAEETFEADLTDREVLRRELLRLAERVAPRLRAAGLAGRTVTLKVRYSSFRTISRSRTIALPIADATSLHREAAALLDAVEVSGGIRLVGVGVTNLVPVAAASQMDLLHDDRWGRLERAADAVRSRFGGRAVTRGGLLDALAPQRSGDAAPVPEQWRRPVQTPGPPAAAPEEANPQANP
jgi:DNA polymerase IV